MDALHVELRGAVVEIDAVLLLLYVGELRVAVAPDLVGDIHQGIDLTLQTGIELLQGMRRLAITPGGVAVSCSLILTLYPLDAAKLVQDVRHGGLGIERIVVTVDIGRTVEAGIGAIDIYGVVRCLEPLAVAVDNLLQALGVLLVVVG